MKFGITYLPYTELDVMPRSGNPGYVPRYPLLISQGDTDKGIKKVSMEGYYAVSSDALGNCLGPDAISSIATRIDFSDDILLSCQITLASQSEFDNYCTNGDLMSY